MESPASRFNFKTPLGGPMFKRKVEIIRPKKVSEESRKKLRPIRGTIPILTFWERIHIRELPLIDIYFLSQLAAGEVGKFLEVPLEFT